MPKPVCWSKPILTSMILVSEKPVFDALIPVFNVGKMHLDPAPAKHNGCRNRCRKIPRILLVFIGFFQKRSFVLRMTVSQIGYFRNDDGGNLLEEHKPKFGRSESRRVGLEQSRSALALYSRFRSIVRFSRCQTVSLVTGSEEHVRIVEL